MPGSVYAYIWHVSRRGQIVLSILSLVIIPLATVPLELQRRIVDDAIGGGSLNLLLALGVAYLLAMIAQGGLKYAVNVYRGKVGECVIRDLREMVYRCTFFVAGDKGKKGAKPPADADKGTVVAMVSAEVEGLGGFVGEGISFPLLQGGTMAAILGYMIWIEPLIAALGIALYLPQIVLVPWLQGIINRHSKKRAELVREMGDFILEKGALAPFDSPLPKPYDGLIGGVYGLRIKIYKVKNFLKFLNNFLTRMGPLGVLLVGGWLVIEGHTQLGTIVAFISGLEKIGEPSRELLGFYRRVSDARVKYNLLVNTFPPMPASPAAAPSTA
ncbi:MAG: ABC transporter ATP-binding protein [Rhodospirillales bacterium]|nr:ABC transporter ATP-binding protein [Rhodospirillales bacterium]